MNLIFIQLSLEGAQVDTVASACVPYLSDRQSGPLQDVSEIINTKILYCILSFKVSKQLYIKYNVFFLVISLTLLKFICRGVDIPNNQPIQE